MNKREFCVVLAIVTLMLIILLSLPAYATTYTYDALGRLKTATYSSQKVLYSYDAGGNLTNMATSEDTVPPTTVIDVNPPQPDGENGWYKTAPMITLSTDETATTYYRWDDGPDTTYTASFAAPEGTHTLSFYSVDLVDNVEIFHYQAFKVDTTAPNAPMFNTVFPINAGNQGNFPVSGYADPGTTVYITASDGTNEVTTTAIAGTTFNVTLDLSSLAPGTITFTAYSKDEAGNVSIVSIPATTTKDVVTPETMINLSGTLRQDGWYTSDVTVTLVATDTSMGVEKTEYSFDNANWLTYTDTFTVSAEGINTVYYRSIDNAGNTEATQEQTVKIDKMIPTVNANPYGSFYNNTQSVTLSASEPANIYYTTDGSEPTTSSAQYIGLPIDILGTTTLKFMAVDTAGNLSQTYTENYVIDTTKPTTTISLSGAYNQNGCYVSDVQVTLTATDMASGVDRTEYNLNNSSWINYTAPFTITTDGTTTVYYRSVDKAGNYETTKSEIIKINKAGFPAAVTKLIQPDAVAGKDAQISQPEAGWNFGTTTLMTMGMSNGARRDLLQFDLSSIPSNAAIAKAELKLNYYGGSSSYPMDISTHRVTSNWSEGTVTWNQRDSGISWAAVGGDFNATPESTTHLEGTYGWYAWDITNLTQMWFNGTVSNYGVLLKCNESTVPNGNYKYFYSSDYGTASLRPQLMVTYTVP